MDEPSPRKPGWVAATDAEQDGVNCASAVQAFWLTLKNAKPKMADEDIERRTDLYQASSLGLTVEFDGEPEDA